MAVWGLVIFVVAFGSPSVAAEDVDSPVLSSPPAGVVTGASLPVRVADPLSQRDIDRMRSILCLAPPQQLYVEAAHERYTEAARTLVSQNSADLWRLSQRAAAAVVPQFLPEFVTLRRELSSREEVLRRSVDTLDAALFSEIESILSDSQRPLLDRVRRRRAIQNCRVEETMMPAINLVALLESPGVLSAEELARLDPALQAFEQEIAPTLIALDQELRDCRIRSSTLLVQEAAPIDSAARAQITAQRVALQDQAATLARRVVDANHRSAASMSAMLGGERGEQLLRYYRARTNDRIFPDALEGRDIHKMSLDIPIDADRRALADDAWQSYARRHEALSNQLIRELTDIQEYVTRHLAYPSDESIQKRVRRLRVDRWNLDIEFVNQLRGIISPVPGSALDKTIDDFGRRAKTVLEQAERDRFPYQ